MGVGRTRENGGVSRSDVEEESWKGVEWQSESEVEWDGVVVRGYVGMGRGRIGLS